jgi:hypothetical protein
MRPSAPIHARAESVEKPEPRWAAIIALLAVGGLDLVLPRIFSAVPHLRGWLMAVIVVLLIPTVLSHHRGRYLTNRLLGLLIAGIVTAALLASVLRLVFILPQLPHYQIAPGILLRAAVVLWLTNVIIFALWYWNLDAGGPHQRDLRAGHEDGAFLFPQMMMDDATRRAMGEEHWSPTFVDYLFLAFNTSTALSPTDTAVLSRWAKILMMLQALISLTIIAIVGARAVNILGPS